LISNLSKNEPFFVIPAKAGIQFSVIASAAKQSFNTEEMLHLRETNYFNFFAQKLFDIRA